tara:strand:+ start:293 stop:487 length:195 start_codon:yes stop_codon:yes gene_type:complete
MAQLNDEQRQELKETLSLEFSNAYRKIDNILTEKFGNDFDVEDVVCNMEESLIDHIQDKLDEME